MCLVTPSPPHPLTPSSSPFKRANPSVMVDLAIRQRLLELDDAGAGDAVAAEQPELAQILEHAEVLHGLVGELVALAQVELLEPAQAAQMPRPGVGQVLVPGELEILEVRERAE